MNHANHISLSRKPDIPSRRTKAPVARADSSPAKPHLPLDTVVLHSDANEENRKMELLRREANKLNGAQRVLKTSSKTAGGWVREAFSVVADRAEKIAREPVRIFPGADLVLDGMETLGVKTGVQVPGAETLGKGVKSATLGVGEFAGKTVETVGEAAAHPIKTVKGLKKLHDGLTVDSPIGVGATAVESVFSDKTYLELRAEKRKVVMDLLDTRVAEFKVDKKKIGLPGASSKLLMEVVGAPRTALTAAPRLVKHVKARKDLAIAERANAKVADAVESSVGGRVADLAKVSENYKKLGVETTLRVGNRDVIVRGLKTKREAKELRVELEQVRARFGDEALKPVSEVIITKHLGDADGLYNPVNRAVAVKRGQVGKGRGVTAHEVGHANDHTIGSYAFKSDGKDSAFGQGGKQSHVSDYARTNRHEDFAETFGEMVVRPDVMRSKVSNDRSGMLGKKENAVATVMSDNRKRFRNQDALEKSPLNRLDRQLEKGDPKWIESFREQFPEIKVPKGRETEFANRLNVELPGTVKIAGPDFNLSRYNSEFAKAAQRVRIQMGL